MTSDRHSTTATDQATSAGERPAHDRLTIFLEQDAPLLDETDVMSEPQIAENIIEQFGARLSDLDVGNKVKVLFRQEGETGFSLVHAWFGPNFQLPRHSHSADCLYYVVKGEARLGNRSVPAGSGFFVPAGGTYGYQAGPDGVEVLEFRHATSFDMVVADKSPGRWTSILDTAVAERETWAAGRPT